jgi:hypothetical protein
MVLPCADFFGILVFAQLPGPFNRVSVFCNVICKEPDCISVLHVMKRNLAELHSKK